MDKRRKAYSIRFKQKLKKKHIVKKSRNKIGEKDLPQQYQQQMNKNQYRWDGNERGKKKESTA